MIVPALVALAADMLVADALAGPLVVVVREDDGTLNGAVPRVHLTDAAGAPFEVDMGDHGTPPDAVADDRVWTGVNRAVGAGPYAIRLSDGGDNRLWEGTFTATGDDPAVLVLAIAPNGVVTALDADALPRAALTARRAPPGGEPGAEGGNPKVAGDDSANGSSTGATAGADPIAALVSLAERQFARPSAGTLAAWLLGVGLFGWVLAGSRRLAPVAIEPVRGTRPELPGRGIVAVSGDWARLVTALAGPFRVVLAGGSAPDPVPDGTVFVLGPGRVAVEDIAAVVRALERHGPPLVVVAPDTVEASGGRVGAEALAELGRLLPGAVVTYTFAGGPPSHTVSADGSLRPIS